MFRVLTPRWIGLAFTILAFLGLSFLLYTHGGQDDTYITYWPARALAEHGAILNYNGARIEQSSSLGLVLVLAILHKVLTIPVPLLGFLASMTAGALTLLLVDRVARQMSLRAPTLAAAATGSVWCFGYWATSGMEMALTSLAALWVILEVARWPAAASRWKWARLAGATFLLAASRPETPFILLGLVATLVLYLAYMRLRRREVPDWSLRTSLPFALVACAVVGGLLLFRWLYFHALLPNPALIKMGGFNVKDGLYYLWDGAVRMGGLLHVMALLGIGFVLVEVARGRIQNVAVLLGAMLCLAQLAFIVISGGDWMSGNRFLAPAVPGMVLVGLYLAERWLTSTGAARTMALALVGMNLTYSVEALHRGDSEGRLAWTWPTVVRQARAKLQPGRFSAIEFGNRYHLRDAFVVDHLMPIVKRVASRLDRPVYVLTGQAGMIAYYLISEQFGKAKLLDLWSLTTRELKNCLPPELTPGSRLGTIISINDALRYANQCDYPLPDVYYNECLAPDAAAVLANHGYQVVYQQVGTIRNSSSDRFVSGQVVADGHIAVRKEHVKALDLASEPVWNWDISAP